MAAFVSTTRWSLVSESHRTELETDLTSLALKEEEGGRGEEGEAGGRGGSKGKGKLLLKLGGALDCRRRCASPGNQDSGSLLERPWAL